MGVREIERFLEQWQMEARDLRRRMIVAPAPRERERWYAMLMPAQGWTASTTAYALERDPHTIGRWAAAFGEGGPAVCAGRLGHRVEPQQLPELPPSPRGQALLYESGPVRRFAGLKLSGPLPGETTILTFRHLLERHRLGQGLPEKINAHLESQGPKLREGTIVDATIIEAPPSTKNRAGERDPEMHQTKKGNQRHLGMKAHMGVDSETGIVHSMSTTSANVHGVTEAHHLLHGGETVAWGDAGCQGVGKGGRTWGWRWNGGWRCVRGGGGGWIRGAGRRWRRRHR